MTSPDVLKNRGIGIKTIRATNAVFLTVLLSSQLSCAPIPQSGPDIPNSHPPLLLSPGNTGDSTTINLFPAVEGKEPASYPTPELRIDNRPDIIPTQTPEAKRLIENYLDTLSMEQIIGAWDVLNLVEQTRYLNENGYILRDGKIYDKNNNPVNPENVLANPVSLANTISAELVDQGLDMGPYQVTRVELERAFIRKLDLTLKDELMDTSYKIEDIVREINHNPVYQILIGSALFGPQLPKDECDRLYNILIHLGYGEGSLGVMIPEQFNATVRHDLIRNSRRTKQWEQYTSDLYFFCQQYYKVDYQVERNGETYVQVQKLKMATLTPEQIRTLTDMGIAVLLVGVSLAQPQTIPATAPVLGIIIMSGQDMSNEGKINDILIQNQ